MASSRSSVSDGSRNETLHCSFCGKDQHTVDKLIAGPDVYICNECIDLCNEIIIEGLAPGVVGFGSSGERSDDELLAVLGRIQAKTAHADAAVHRHVAILRKRGTSWTRIGEALGVSKQAAWERFSEQD